MAFPALCYSRRLTGGSAPPVNPQVSRVQPVAAPRAACRSPWRSTQSAGALNCCRRFSPRGLTSGDANAIPFVCRASSIDGDRIQDADLVALRVAGLSVSDSGFVALLALQPQEADESTTEEEAGVLPVQVTSRDVDTHRAESIEALTLLQLVQGIDVGVRLPIEALVQACPGVPEGSLLRRVVLQSVSAPNSSQDGPSLTAYLHVSADSYPAHDPFTVLGLALRYKAPLSTPRALWASLALSPRAAAATYPEALLVEEAAQQAHAITHNISLAWQVAANPIGQNDIVAFRRQLSQVSKKDRPQH